MVSMKMIVKYAFVLYDVEIAYDSSFDYNVIVICIWLCTSKVIWNLDFLEVFFKTWISIADLFYIGNVTQKIWSFSTLYIIPNILFTVQKSAILVVSHFYSIIFHLTFSMSNSISFFYDHVLQALSMCACLACS